MGSAANGAIVSTSDIGNGKEAALALLRQCLEVALVEEARISVSVRASYRKQAISERIVSYPVKCCYKQPLLLSNSSHHKQNDLTYDSSTSPVPGLTRRVQWFDGRWGSRAQDAHDTLSYQRGHYLSLPPSTHQ